MTHFRSKVGLVGSLSMLLVLGGVATSACVERSHSLSQADREKIKDFVSTTAPHPQHPLEVRFDNKIKLLGYDTSSEVARPGQKVTLTWYWQVEFPLEEGWQQFTHLATGEGENLKNEDGTGTIRQVYPAGKWRAGEFIKDVQEIEIPGNWTSSRVVFYLGFYKGDERLSVASGPSDGDNRARAASLRTTAVGEAPPPPPPLPELAARQATGAITIDGRIDEADWGHEHTPRFVNTMSGATAEPESSARVLWDAQNLYVAFEVADTFLKSSFTNNDDHLWEQDCVEIMVDPDGDGRNYFELQVAPTGKSFDTAYDTPRQPQPFGHVDWNSGLRAAVQARGTVNDDANDQGYTVEIAIPWTAFSRQGVTTPTPQAGGTWRMNFFVMDTLQDGSERATGWSPPRVRDFHTLGKFGRVQFTGATTAAAEPAPGAAAAPGATAEAPAGGRAIPRLDLPLNVDVHRLLGGAPGQRLVGQAAPPPDRPVIVNGQRQIAPRERLPAAPVQH